MAPPEECFAVATPCEGESHYSLYLSRFGRDLKAGETAKSQRAGRRTGIVSDDQAIPHSHSST